MYACPQEHTRENLHVRTKLTRAENVRLTSQAQLQPHLGALSGSSEITNALSGIRKSALREQIQAWRRARKANLETGSEQFELRRQTRH